MRKCSLKREQIKRGVDAYEEESETGGINSKT